MIQSTVNIMEKPTFQLSVLHFIIKRSWHPKQYILVGTDKAYQYSITCIQRPLKGSNESGLLQQVVFNPFSNSPGFNMSALQVF